MKKIISVFLSVVMLCCVMVPFASATPAEDAKLQFNEDGTFKIMNLADIQDDALMLSITAEYIDAAVAAEQPDLIILTGDNIAGHITPNAEKSAKAIRNVMNILEPYGIPVAIVFGNHDDDGGRMSKEDQMKVYEEYSCFIGMDEGEEIDGVGTYNVPIFSSTDADDIVFNCWLFDSGSYDENGGYDHVKQSQLDWYKAKSAELKAANGGEVVPSIAFQHIIVPEIFEALEEVPSNVDGAINKNGKFYILPETAAEGSFLGEPPCPSATNGGEFDAFLEGGDVLGIVTGHDHSNSFIVPYKGIDLINSPTCGFQSYGMTEVRGIRMFTLNESAPAEYETYLVSYADLFADDAFAMFKHDFFAFFSNFIAIFSSFFGSLSGMFGI